MNKQRQAATNEYCPACGRALILRDSGRPASPYLVVMDAPAERDLTCASVYDSTSGYVIQQEMAHARINYQQCHATSFWMHLPPEIKGKKPKLTEVDFKCIEYMRKKFYQNTEGKKGVIIMGKNALAYLTDMPTIADWVGLDIRDKLIVPLQIPVICCISASACYGSSVGEVRLAFKRLKESVTL